MLFTVLDPQDMEESQEYHDPFFNEVGYQQWPNEEVKCDQVRGVVYCIMQIEDDQQWSDDHNKFMAVLRNTFEDINSRIPQPRFTHEIP